MKFYGNGRKKSRDKLMENEIKGSLMVLFCLIAEEYGGGIDPVARKTKKRDK